MSKGKKFLIALLVLVAIATAAFFYFHDDSDVEAIEEEQQADIDSVVPEKFDELNSSFSDLESDSTLFADSSVVVE